MKKSIAKKLFILAAVVMVLSWFLPGAALAAPPTAPSGLLAITINGGRVDLHWNDNSLNETGFNVYRAPDVGGLEPGTYALLGSVAPDVKIFSDTTVIGSTAYWYQVYAVNADGLSFPSNQVRIITPAAAPQIALAEPVPSPTAPLQSGFANIIKATTNVPGGSVVMAQYQFLADNAPGVFDAHDILNPPMDLTILPTRATSVINNAQAVPANFPAGAIVEFEIHGTISAAVPPAGATIGWYQIGTPALNVYESVTGQALSTKFVGSRRPGFNDTVKIIAYRTAAAGPLVAKSITYIAPPSVPPQPIGAPAVIVSYLLNGALVSITPPDSGPGYLMSGEIWEVGTGMFRSDAPDFPAYIDPSITTGTNITVRFAGPRAEANVARGIWRQISKAIGVSTDPDPMFDDTDVPLNVPTGTWVYAIVDGVVSDLDLVKGVWTVGPEAVKCYQDALTLVAPATYGDEVLFYGRRTLTPGPIVLEQTHNILPGRLIASFKGTAVEMHLMYNGTLQSKGPNIWRVGGQDFIVDDIEGEARIDSMPFPAFNIGDLVTVEFEHVGEVLPDPTLWQPLANTAGMWTDTLTLPEVPQDQTGRLFLRVKGQGQTGLVNDLYGSSSKVNVTLKALPTSMPADPTGLAANIVSGSRVDLSWTDNAVNEGNYRVERSPDGATWSTIATLGIDANAYSDTSVAPDNMYSYRVIAHNVLGDSAASNIVTVALALPAAPTSLILGGGTGQVDLTWNDNANGETGYRIYRNQNAAGWVLIFTTGQNATTYSDMTVLPNTPYAYRVTAFNIIGESTAVEAAITTGGAPATPTLSATLVSATQIDLTWVNNAAVVTSYRIERSTNGGAFTQIATPAFGVTAYSDMTVTANNNYQYRIYAINVVGPSPASNVVPVSTALPAAPTGVAANAASNQMITVTWNAGGAEVNGYTVERSTDNANWTVIGTTNAATTTFDDTNVTLGNTYYYRVRANSVVGTSGPSTPAAQVIFSAPQAPVLNTATPVATGEVNLAWTDASLGETGFKIMRTSTADNVTVQVGTANANAVSFSDTSAMPETTYQYAIVAFNGFGDSAPSNMLMVTTATPAAAPNAPTDLAATALAYNQVRLTWTDNSNNEAGFRISRSTDNASFAQIATVNVNVTTYTDGTAVGNTTYYYLVTAYNSQNDSGLAGPASVKTPAQPAPASGGGGGGGGGGTGLPVTLTGLTTPSSLRVDISGYTIARTELKSTEQDSILLIPVNTRMLTAQGQRLRQITHSHIPSPAPLPEGYMLIGSVHSFGPEGATFTPAVTLELLYPALPTGVNEDVLSAVTWTGSAWEFMSGDLDTAANMLVLRVSHFSTYAIIAEIPVAPPVPTTTPPAPTTTPPVPTTTLPPITTTTAPPPAQTTPPPAQTTTATAPPPAQTTPTTTNPAAATGGPDWPLIAGIAGGAIVIILAIFLLARRRRTA